MTITDAKLIENYERMFDMPAWRAYTDGLVSQQQVLSDINTMAPDESLEVRKAKLSIITQVLSFETNVRSLVNEATREEEV